MAPTALESIHSVARTRESQGSLLALTLETFTQGTGAGYRPRLLEEGVLLFRGLEPARGEGTWQAPTPRLASPAQMVSSIRDVMALRMSELAQIFGVSRRAVYDWIEGATPKPDTLARLSKLNDSAEALRAEGMTHMGHFIHRPLISGRSLLDLMKSGESVEAAIDIIKRAAREEARKRAQLGRRTSGSNTEGADGVDEMSTPIF